AARRPRRRGRGPPVRRRRGRHVDAAPAASRRGPARVRTGADLGGAAARRRHIPRPRPALRARAPRPVDPGAPDDRSHRM
ncbi:MAG: hypothetical protein AVDCRST_MAG54-1233, partial [uncultured Actinomycetospora sp.]